MTALRQFLFLLLILNAPTICVVGQNNPQAESKDSCLTKLNIFSYRQLDSATQLVEKRLVTNLSEKMKSCLSSSTNIKFDPDYRDSAFEMIIPVFLKRSTFSFGETFMIMTLIDSSVGFNYPNAAIWVYYDFSGTWEKVFQSQYTRGDIKTMIKDVDGKKLHLYNDLEGRYAGRINLGNNRIIMFTTRDRQHEKALEQALLTFKWK